MSPGKSVARAARISILVFAGAMALRQMELANEIINLAFGLLLGAIEWPWPLPSDWVEERSPQRRSRNGWSPCNRKLIKSIFLFFTFILSFSFPC